jgi:hypothetical protein
MLHCISNTICLNLIVTILFTIYNNYYLYFTYFSSEISWINLENDLKCSCISLLFLSGQLSVFDTPDINLSLSFYYSFLLLQLIC